MKFDVIITHIGGVKAKNIVARHLAHDPSISLQKALSLLENPPVVYAAGVPKDDAQYLLRQLRKIQVTAKIVEVQLAPLLPHAVAPFVPDHAPASQPQPALPEHAAAHNTPSPPQLQPAQPAPEPAAAVDGLTKRNIVVRSSVALALLLLAAAAFIFRKSFDWNHAFSLDWSKAGLVTQDIDAKKSEKKKSPPGPTVFDSSDQKTAPAFSDSADDPQKITDEQKIKAAVLTDSGNNAIDASQAVAFFKLAIAFNKRNVTAWYALHEAYVSARMSAEAEKTDAQMRKLFGDNVFSIAKIIEPFGRVDAASLTEDGIYRVEYASKQPAQSQGLADAYLLARALKGSCLCNALSLYVKISAGKGMLVYVRTDSFPASFDEFKATANITYLK